MTATTPDRRAKLMKVAPAIEALYAAMEGATAAAEGTQAAYTDVQGALAFSISATGALSFGELDSSSTLVSLTPQQTLALRAFWAEIITGEVLARMAMLEEKKAAERAA